MLDNDGILRHIFYLSISEKKWLHWNSITPLK